MVLLIVPFLLNGMTRVYEEKTKDQLTTHRFDMETTLSGYSVNLQTETGDTVIKQTFAVDTNLAALTWAFENPKENTKVTASREGNKIFLKGQSRGKPIEKTVKINELSWYQTLVQGVREI